MPDASADAQEPWDYERFVAIYNAIALDRAGWRYEADGRTPDELGERYRSSPATYPTLRDFAEGLFIWEQRLNL